MGGKLNVYNLGELGVNITKSPLHHADGEMLSCQNAEFNAESGVGGIRKRPGLQRVNSSALAGTVRGVVGVPLPGPGLRSVFAQRPSSPWFRTTTNGTTWANGTFNSAPAAIGVAFTDYPIVRAAMLPGRFFYPVNSAGTGIVMGYDGLMEFELYRCASASAFRVLCAHSGTVIFTESTDVTRVFSIDTVSGIVTQVGDTFPLPLEVYCGVSWLGKIWIGTAKTTDTFGKIYSAKVGTGVWTLDRTAVAGQRYNSMAIYHGELFVSTSFAGAGTAAIIEKRTVDGTWSTSVTGAQVVQNAYDGLVVADDKLFAAYHDQQGGSAAFCSIQVWNGAAWSTSLDLQPQAEIGVFGSVAAGSTVFFNTFDAGVHSKVWRKVSGGAFAAVDTTVGGVTAGVMGVI